MNKVIIRVIAGSYEEFMYWLQSNRLNPRDYRYCASPNDIRGIRDPILIVERFWLNPAYYAAREDEYDLREYTPAEKETPCPK